MKKHLLTALILLLTAAGCRSHHEASLGPVPAQGFVLEWPADLNLKKDPVKALHVAGGSLIAYTTSNKGYWLTSTGGQLQAVNQIAPKNHTLYPPLSLGDHIIIPTTVSLEVYDRRGQLTYDFKTPTSVQSPCAGLGNSLYLGVSHTGSGRLAKFDVGTKLTVDWELYTPAGIVAAPAVLNDTVFAAGIDGSVIAVTNVRLKTWALPDNTFRTAGPITADLSVDDYGLYVASQDQKLYCLDRSTGKIKWTFYADVPLVDQPIVIGNVVYQIIPNRGLAAINKSDGKMSREPMWVQPLARQVLSSDEKNIYVRIGRGGIAALDKATGDPQFQSSRNDMTVFATNLTSPMIYAATKSGQILAIKPVLKPGGVGEVVFNVVPDSTIASAR